MTDNNDPEDAALIALGDQVQTMVATSNADIVAFILINTEGVMEFRSMIPRDTFKQILTEAADSL